VEEDELAGFEQLRVWHEARRLAREVYRMTESFPVKEQYGITSQIRRAAVSVMSNIAEGHGRHSRPELLRFLIYVERLSDGSEEPYNIIQRP
jgi:four helix bundle protein